MKHLIEQFYEAFANHDAEGMAACYHDDVVFEDPAFGVLEKEHASNMWRMLLKSQKGKEFRVVASNIQEDAAHWEAFYTFSKTGRSVHNKIDAQFEFKDGKIIRHTDNFDLYAWSRQAIGFQGTLVGWTSFFKKKLQAQTQGMLAKFEAS